jgi:hypothetical protein
METVMNRNVCAHCAVQIGLGGMAPGAGDPLDDGSVIRTCRARGGGKGPGIRVAEMDPVAEPGSVELALAAPLAAERPDAAPGRLDQVLRAAAHAVVLLAVVAFVVGYCLVMPLRARLTAGRDCATVTLVAGALADVRGPDTGGVFRAVRPLPHGARVLKGEVLGRVDAPELERQFERAALELRLVEIQRLRLALASRGDGHEPEAADARELAGRVAVARQVLSHLDTLRSQLDVLAPADGVVQQGLPASLGVTARQTIVCLYTDVGGSGADLRIEVTAPLDVVTELERSGRVTTTFATAEGKSQVVATPVPASVRQFRKSVGTAREEVWATVQCVPRSLAPGLRRPGLMGSLGS